MMNDEKYYEPSGLDYETEYERLRLDYKDLTIKYDIAVLIIENLSIWLSNSNSNY